VSGAKVTHFYRSILNINTSFPGVGERQGRDGRMCFTLCRLSEFSVEVPTNSCKE
jgi:hypothetical protein